MAYENQSEGSKSLDQREHNSDASAKRVVLRGQNPDDGEWYNIGAVDNGDGTFSLATTSSGGGGDGYVKLAGSDANQRDSTFYGDGLSSGVAAVHNRYFDGAGYNRTPAAKTLIDKTTTTDIIYIGSAPIGTATSASSWQITKVDKTTSPISITYAAAGAFTATWNNRATTEVYT